MFLCTISVLLGVIFVEQMGHPMELFLCYVCSMILHDMLTRGVAKEKVCDQVLFYFTGLRFGSTLYCFFSCCSLLHTGAFAVYLEPWHADIFEFLDLRKNHGKVLLDS